MPAVKTLGMVISTAWGMSAGRGTVQMIGHCSNDNQQIMHATVHGLSNRYNWVISINSAQHSIVNAPTTHYGRLSSKSLS